MIVSIDPGIHALGWALWTDGGELSRCGLSRADGRDLSRVAHLHALTVPEATIAIVESMVTQGGGSKVPPQDLIDVQTVGCLTARGVARIVRLVKPYEWKGNIPKGIHHARFLAVLEGVEQTIAANGAAHAGANAKEVYDAIGIGLWFFKRTNKDGVKRT